MNIFSQKAKKQESWDSKQILIASLLQSIPISRNRPRCNDILLAYFEFPYAFT